MTHKSPPSAPDTLTAANRLALRGLRRQWLVAALITVPACGVGYALLSHTAFEPYTGRWLLFASLTAAAILALLWHILPRNHRPDEQTLFTNFGVGTCLSLISGLLLVYLAGFLFNPWPIGWLAWAPAMLYLASRIVDLFDGYAARITDHVTEAGATLDIELDGLGLLIAVLIGVQYSQLPIWYLILAASRQLFVAGMWWRRRMGKPVYDMTASENRRIIAGCQTGFIAIVLWPIVAPPATTLAAALFAIPLIVSFARDWLVVSGVMNPQSASYQRRRYVGKQIVEHWLPLLARIMGGVVGAVILVQLTAHIIPGEIHHFAWLLTIIFSATLVCFTLGAVGRVAALFVIVLAMLDMQVTGFQWYGNALLLVCGVIVLHVGSGRYALWSPEEPWVHHRLGDQKSLAE